MSQTRSDCPRRLTTSARATGSAWLLGCWLGVVALACKDESADTDLADTAAEDELDQAERALADDSEERVNAQDTQGDEVAGEEGDPDATDARAAEPTDASSGLNDAGVMLSEGSDSGDESMEALPDLVFSGYSVNFLRAGDGSVRVCLNRDAEGNDVELGHYLAVENRGTAAAESYTVRFGLIDNDQSLSHAFPLKLTTASAHGPRARMRWEGPLCSELTGLAAGRYRLWFEADATGVIAESDETNNRIYGLQTYVLEESDSSPPAERDLPDLALSGFSVQVTGPEGPWMRICVNRNADGDDVDNGDYIEVTNRGTADAAPYTIRFGLRDEGADQEHVFPLQLTRSEPHDAGESLRWEGPFCSELDDVPVGTYHLWVEAVRDDTLEESDERNNRITGSKEYTFEAESSPLDEETE